MNGAPEIENALHGATPVLAAVFAEGDQPVVLRESRVAQRLPVSGQPLRAVAAAPLFPADEGNPAVPVLIEMMERLADSPGVIDGHQRPRFFGGSQDDGKAGTN